MGGLRLVEFERRRRRVVGAVYNAPVLGRRLPVFVRYEHVPGAVYYLGTNDSTVGDKWRRSGLVGERVDVQPLLHAAKDTAARTTREAPQPSQEQELRRVAISPGLSARAGT